MSSRILLLCFTIYTCAVKSETCAGCPTKFINDPLGCEYWTLLNKDGCTGWSNVKTVEARIHADPVMHEPISAHCVFMASYSIAKNKGFLTDTTWTKLLWNVRGRKIDKIFNQGKVAAQYGKGNWKAMSRQFNRYRGPFGGGEFHALLQQLMFESVGLNFAVNEPFKRNYPGYWTEKFQLNFKFRRGKEWHKAKRDLAWYKKVLNGDAMFKNRAYNKEKTLVPMVGIIIGVNGWPFQKEYNHDTAVIKHTNGHFYYLDSNVKTIRTLIDGTTNPPMTNLYHDSPISFDPSNPTPGWDNGYLVDWSLDLGTDVNVAAQWLYNKIEVRPRYIDKSSIPSMNVADSGGAMFFRVIVKGTKRTWDDILQEYKKFANKDDAAKNSNKIKQFVVGLNNKALAKTGGFQTDWLTSQEFESEETPSRAQALNLDMVDMTTDDNMYQYYLMVIGFVLLCVGCFCVSFLFGVCMGFKYFDGFRKNESILRVNV